MVKGEGQPTGLGPGSDGGGVLPIKSLGRPRIGSRCGPCSGPAHLPRPAPLRASPSAVTCVFSMRGWKPHFSSKDARTMSGVQMGVKPLATMRCIVQFT